MLVVPHVILTEEKFKFAWEQKEGGRKFGRPNRTSQFWLLLNNGSGLLKIQQGYSKLRRPPIKD